MSNKLQLIEKDAAEELDLLKARITDYDREFHSAFQRQMGFAFLAGMALVRAKEIVPHGKFLEWRESELPDLSRSSASRYSQFAEALSKDPTVGSLREVKLLGTGDALTVDQLERINKAVHDIADGKTLTEMYRDLGVIRQPKKQAHHPKQVTPEEEIESKKDAANAELDLVCGYYRSWLAEDDETLATADQKKRKELRDLQITVGKRIKAMSPKAKAAKKKGGAK